MFIPSRELRGLRLPVGEWRIPITSPRTTPGDAMGGVTSDRPVLASPTMSDSPRITRRSLFRGVGSVTVVAS